MTSPVDTSVKHFFSSMSGAPVLTKSAGALVALLDALLVLGFDTKSATGITVSGGVATLAFSGDHSATPLSVILVGGVDGAYAALNGEQKVTTRGDGKLTFPTTLPAGTATGAITFKMAPVGWEKTYASENIAVYRSLDPTSNRHYLRVDDRGGQPSPHVARVRGYTTMTGVSTGTGLFPISTQIEEDAANGGWWPKGYQSGAGTNPIGWSFFADSKIFYYAPMIYQSDLTPAQAPRYCASHLIGFGDLKPYRTGGDAWCTGLSVGFNSSAPQSYMQSGSFNSGESYAGGNVMPRKADGSGTSQIGVTVGYMFRGVDALSGGTSSELGPFPNTQDGALVYAPRYWRTRSIQGDADYVPRAEVPGILTIPQSGVFAALGRGPLLDGEGAYLGRKLYGVVTGTASTDVDQSPTAVGMTLVDLTGPWR